MEADFFAAMMAELKSQNELTRVLVAQNEELKAQNQELLKQQEKANELAYLEYLLKKEVYTLQEAADFIGISYNTITKWTGQAGNGRIGYYQEGKLIYITKAECLRVMQLTYHPSALELLKQQNKKGAVTAPSRRTTRPIAA